MTCMPWLPRETFGSGTLSFTDMHMLRVSCGVEQNTTRILLQWSSLPPANARRTAACRGAVEASKDAVWCAGTGAKATPRSVFSSRPVDEVHSAALRLRRALRIGTPTRCAYVRFYRKIYKRKFPKTILLAATCRTAVYPTCFQPSGCVCHRYSCKRRKHAFIDIATHADPEHVTPHRAHRAREVLSDALDRVCVVPGPVGAESCTSCWPWRHRRRRREAVTWAARPASAPSARACASRARSAPRRCAAVEVAAPPVSDTSWSCLQRCSRGALAPCPAI